MGLLGDFLLGAATQGGREILNRTLADDERQRVEARQEALYKRKRDESEADYKRRRQAAIEDADRAEKSRLRLQAEAAEAAERKTLSKQRAGADALTIAGTQGLLQSELDSVKKGSNPFTTASGEDREGNAINVPDDKRFMDVMSTYNKALAQTMTGVSPKTLAEGKRVEMKNDMISRGELDKLRMLERAEAGKGRYELNSQGTLDHETQAFTPKPEKKSGGSGGPTPYQISRDSRADVAEARRERDRADKLVSDAKKALGEAIGKDRKAAAAAELDAAQQALKDANTELTAAQQQVVSLNPNKKPLLSGAAGAPTAPPPAPKADAAAVKVEKRGDVFVPKTAAEYESLPAGALYEKNGKTYRKKG